MNVDVKPLISIIIPCYNDAKYIQQAVMSALNQTYSNIEIIVVDDGSNHETKNVLKALLPKISRLITQDNKGQSTARNVGIEASSGDYILTLDSDDFFEPSFCEKAIIVLQNKDVKIVSCYANLLFDDGTTTLYKPVGGDINNFLYSNGALGTALYRKKDWFRFGRYDESMKKGFEDWEFFIRLLSDGGSAHIIQEILYSYRKRQSSTTTIANKYIYDNLRYMMSKNKELYVNHYENTIDFLLNKIAFEEKERYKNLHRLEYRIGFYFLKPFRKIKRLFI